MLLKKAWGDLRARKLRTLLVVLSIAIGVLGGTFVKVLGDTLLVAVSQKYPSYHMPDLTIDTTPFSAAVRDKVAAVTNVETAEGRLTGTVRWEIPSDTDRRADIAIQGVADFASAAMISRPRITLGEAPKAGEILFEKGSRVVYSLSVGQEVTLVGPDGDKSFKISGFAENPSVVDARTTGFASAWLRHAEAEPLLKLDGDNRLLIKMRDNAAKSVREDTQKRVDGVLDAENVAILSSTLRDPSDIPGLSLLQTLQTVLLLFSVVTALASGLLVINTMSTVVLEQRAQIGSMKAVGGTTGIVLRSYLILALLYGTLGTILGFLPAILMNLRAAQARAEALDEAVAPIVISPEAVALALGIGLGVSLVAAVIPSWLGARVTIREAMASYGLSADFGNGLWDRLVARLTMLPQAARLASRNVFRQSSRALFTIVGLAIATAVVLAVIGTLFSLNSSMEAAAKVIDADLVFVLNTPADPSTIDTALEDVQGIDRRELWLGTSAKVGGKDVSLTGLPADTQVFAKDTVQSGGKWLEAGKADQIVLTTRLAQRLDRQVNARVDLESGSRPVQQWTVVGILPGTTGDIAATDGGAYGPFDAVRALVDFPEGRGNQLYVRLDDRDRTEMGDKANTISDALATANVANMAIKLYEQREQTQQTVMPFIFILVPTIFIAAAIGSLGLFSTLTMNVFERRREIGVMRSVGASTGTLLWTFLLEGLLLATMGWLVGIILGGPAGRMLVQFLSEKQMYMVYVLPPASPVATLLVILLVAFIASIGPALTAARMRIADILRYG